MATVFGAIEPPSGLDCRRTIRWPGGTGNRATFRNALGGDNVSLASQVSLVGARGTEQASLGVAHSMIRRIEALGYRCLQDVNQTLGSFHVLVGPNASGKTTFLDVVVFLGDLVSGGL